MLRVKPRHSSTPVVWYDSTSIGSCILITGKRRGWPIIYVIIDVAANTLSVTVSSLPRVSPMWQLQQSSQYRAQQVSHRTDSSLAQDSFHSRYRPDNLIILGTTTHTITVLSTSTYPTILMTTQTAYDI